MLVDYSDSASEAEDTSANTTDTSGKRKREDSPPNANRAKLPPLPSSFHSVYATNVRTSTRDDPSLHGGRTRQVVHVSGNWPTHIYLECPYATDAGSMSLLTPSQGILRANSFNGLIRSLTMLKYA